MIATNSNNIYPKFYHYAIRYYDTKLGEYIDIDGIAVGTNYAMAAQFIEKVYDTNIVYMNLYETFPVISADELDEILNH